MSDADFRRAVMLLRDPESEEPARSGDDYVWEIRSEGVWWIVVAPTVTAAVDLVMAEEEGARVTGFSRVTLRRAADCPIRSESKLVSLASLLSLGLAGIVACSEWDGD